MDIFNNREVAIGIWLLAFVAFAVSIKSVRQSIPSLWQTFLHPKILTPLFLMLVYVAAVVFVLFESGFWNTSQLKNTIFWTLSVAIVSMFRIPQISKDEAYFRILLKDNFKIIVILEFVIAFYTFSLLTELVIVPALTFLVTLQAVSETEHQYRQVSRLLANILTAIGCGLVLYAGFMIVLEPSSFFQAGTFSDFTLPIALTILFLPFLFALSLYAQYESLFARIHFLYVTDSERRRAKRTALFGIHIQTPLLKRWLRYVQLHRPREPDEFERSIRYVKTQMKNEKNPPQIPIDKGWSPYLASKFLSSLDLETGDYIQDGIDKNQWFSNSKYLDVSGGEIPNSIAYYVEGTEQCAIRLKLVANVNDIASVRTLRNRLLTAVEQLMAEALGCSLPSELSTAIKEDSSISMNVTGKKIDYVKVLWPSESGYELRFTLVTVHPMLTEASPEEYCL